MTQDDKELLLKDLCARLPYGVKIELMPVTKGKCVTLTPIILRDYFIFDNVNYLPYLRPMSSMTEEEAKTIFELSRYKTKDILQIKITNEYLEAKIDDGCCSFERHVIWYGEIVKSTQVFDWLNSHHFDFRNLIDKGLAIDCTNLNIY